MASANDRVLPMKPMASLPPPNLPSEPRTPNPPPDDRSGRASARVCGRAGVHPLDQIRKRLRHDLPSHLERGCELAGVRAQVAVQQLEALDGLERRAPGVDLVHESPVERTNPPGLEQLPPEAGGPAV